MEMSQLRNFYKGLHVFVTGATGFLGKMLIEKLLRSTDVQKIYLLVREKKKKNAKCRIEELFNEIIFQQMKIECPDYQEKIVCISGDCSLVGLGLIDSDKKLLIDNINVVFHNAATVRFNEELRMAYKVNVEGTGECLTLCKQMKHLNAFMHVSTAYTNCIYENVEEKFYDYNMHYKDMGQLIKNLTDKEINDQLKTFLGDFPNTYSFTKALAESYIRENSDGFPIGIFRPSIVISTYKEPLEGWIDNYNGPVAASVHMCLGTMRICPINKKKKCDIVPVDYCVAALIASAWDVSIKKGERISENLPIYNYVSSVENPVTWYEFLDSTCTNGLEYPFSDASWAINITFTKYQKINNFLRFIYHYLPAAMMDLLRVLIFKKPRYISFYNKLHIYHEMVQYFSLRDWNFKNDNVVNLWKKMNQIDRDLFPFSMRELPWFIYFKIYVKGLRQHLMKDPIETVETAKIKQRRLQIAHYVFKAIFFYICSMTVHYQIVSKIFKLLEKFCLNLYQVYF